MNKSYWVLTNFTSLTQTPKCVHGSLAYCPCVFDALCVCSRRLAASGVIIYRLWVATGASLEIVTTQGSRFQNLIWHLKSIYFFD